MRTSRHNDGDDDKDVGQHYISIVFSIDTRTGTHLTWTNTPQSSHLMLGRLPIRRLQTGHRDEEESDKSASVAVVGLLLSDASEVVAAEGAVVKAKKRDAIPDTPIHTRVHSA